MLHIAQFTPATHRENEQDVKYYFPPITYDILLWTLHPLYIYFPYTTQFYEMRPCVSPFSMVCTEKPHSSQYFQFIGNDSVNIIIN